MAHLTHQQTRNNQIVKVNNKHKLTKNGMGGQQRNQVKTKKGKTDQQ
jgi:hypothetical protein